MTDPTPPDPYKPFADARVDALTTKLAAAEALLRDLGVALDPRTPLNWQKKYVDAQAKLAAAEAVIEAVEAHLADDLDLERATKLDDALTAYRAKDTQ